MPGRNSYRTSQSSRRTSNQSSLSTSENSFRTSSFPERGGRSAGPPHGGGGVSGGGSERRGFDSSESYEESYGQSYQYRKDPTSLLHLESSLSSIPSMEDIEDVQSYDLQLFAYRFIYVLQGAFMGLLGPSLQYFSQLALTTSNLNNPVSSFGPIFAAHGGAALLMSFVSELVLNVTIEMNLMKYLMVGILLSSGAWYACLTPVAAASGNLGVGIYFIAKGVWSALLNITLNRCVLWVAGEKIERGRSLVTSLNFAYGFGAVLGPAIALALNALSLELSYAFYGLAVATVIPIAIIVATASPRPIYGRDEHQTLLGFEDPTRRVPTVPSPIVGGVFLHVKHYGGSANYNPDTYDPQNNLIILMVTIFATVLFGTQLGLGAFLFDYLGHVLKVSSTPLTEQQIYVWGCVLMLLFWASLWLSYCFFSSYMFHALNLFSIFHLSIACMVSSFGILFGAETGFATFTFCLILFGFALAPLFTLNIHCLTRVINELLIRRVSSLIVFGCGMGEIFLPVLMGFFMSGQSGQMYGSVAVSYMTFILSISLVGVSGVLLMMVKQKLKEHADQMNKLANRGGPGGGGGAGGIKKGGGGGHYGGNRGG
uniref:Major facilitator superfamily (MFS) profile domain-containing protein n=1 Tax=Globisporangium ultimum (strain ATCC 200006 / CBS 805.95 / DAOM BR144) TaxID=431595 RepID=K3WY73_GLOUD